LCGIGHERRAAGLFYDYGLVVADCLVVSGPARLAEELFDWGSVDQTRTKKLVLVRWPNSTTITKLQTVAPIAEPLVGIGPVVLH